MKARKVKGLDPAGPLADQIERIVRVRLAELESFMPDALEDSEALHDMRIAAKRLRYILEVAHPVFGDYAEKAVDLVKGLQEILGDIHDADVQIPEVLDVIDAVLDERRESSEPLGDTCDGLIALAGELNAHRRERFADFVTYWEDLQRKGFAARLAFSVQERPAAGPRLESP